MPHNEDLLEFCHRLATFARETPEEQIAAIARRYGSDLFNVEERLRRESESIRTSNATMADLLWEFANLLNVYTHPGH